MKQEEGARRMKESGERSKGLRLVVWVGFVGLVLGGWVRLAEATGDMLPPCPDGACSAFDTCVCAPKNDCHTSKCDVDAGKCMDEPVADGDACQGENDCMTYTCQAGECMGVPGNVGADCDDSNGCTTLDTCDGDGGCKGTMDCPEAGECQVGVGSCDPSIGHCIYEAAEDGTPCAHGSCGNGVCTRREGCLNDDDCGSSEQCSPEGTCVPRATTSLAQACACSAAGEGGASPYPVACGVVALFVVGLRRRRVYA